ncbi:MAG: DUF1844 domain-containing protein [Desulfomonile tiedjei]|nr:DUF1844 domain-containing protein [Desulfomonile tiedjei]
MEDPESNEGFTVKDRRRFTTEGASKDEPQPEEQVKESPQEEAEAKEEPTAGPQPPPRPMDFATLILSLANTALFQLGLIRASESEEVKKDLPGARQTIDLIALLEEKTKGNLTEQEARILKETLFQLRLAFVEVSK